MLIDTHAHLDDKAFREDIDKIIKISKESTIERIITSGTDINSSKRAIELAEKYDIVFASIGIDPQHAHMFNENSIQQIEELAKNPKVVAIGEIGLEYREHCPDREYQKYVFAEQIKLAYKLQKPIVIHTREAIADTLIVLKENQKYLTYGGTFHCFSESKEIAKEVIKLGFYISVGGVSTFKNARKIKEALEIVPIENIIFETDCPYLAPEPFRGQKNNPSLIPYIAENLAKLKGISVEEVARITTDNARRLFKF